MQTIAITGASGFIGKHVVAELLSTGGYEIRILSRDILRDSREGGFRQGVDVFEGDLSDPDSLKGFLVPGCTVINLVYLWNAGEALNLACTHNLLAACKDAKVARLIHCSTAAVAGQAANDLIDEQTQCLPISEYGTTKLMVERDIIDFTKGHFDAVILRPTSVFGIDGEPLKKLAADIVGGSCWKNYLKSCLFGRRRMNLVHVANVVEAIVFLANYSGHFDGDIFNVSDDDDPVNNFVDVEGVLMDALDVKKYYLPRLPLPLTFLKYFLILMGRNNVNPRCNFDSSKLRKLGYKAPIAFSAGLAEYATWYRSTYISRQESVVS